MGRLYIAESELNSVHDNHETKTLGVEYSQKVATNIAMFPFAFTKA